MDERASSRSSTAEQGKEAAEHVKSHARNFAEQQKQAGAAQMDDVSEAVKAAADELRDKVPLASEYVDSIAGRLGSVASALHEKSVNELVGNVTDFARHQPVAFFAGAIAAGFALSRFAKSSARREDHRNA